jgi:hypothetical protein
LLAQNNVGIGTQTPHASAVLDVSSLSSTNRGLLAPRMTTAQRNAIANPAKGLLVYDTDINSLFHYNGSVWKNLVPDFPKVAFAIKGVHASHLTVPNFSPRRVQYAGTEYDLTQSYTTLVNNYDPLTSSTFLIPVSGIYHLDVSLAMANTSGINIDEVTPELQILQVRNGNTTIIAATKVGERNVDNINHYMYLQISSDLSLLAGDRIYVNVKQINVDERSFIIMPSNSWFTGHLIIPL